MEKLAETICECMNTSQHQINRKQSYGIEPYENGQ